MPTITHTEVFQFHELGETAQEKARDWYREGGFDYEWWEFIFDAAREIGAILGFEIGEGEISFAGFWSPSDGASFTATWSVPTSPVKAMTAYAPKDERLHSLARDAWAIVRGMTERDEAFSVYRNGRSRNGRSISRACSMAHEGSMHCDHAAIESLAKNFARWIYNTLESEWDYMNSDEQVDEAIIAAGYTFTTTGQRFGESLCAR